MTKCGYVVHKTMPEFLSRQCEMDQSQQGAALSTEPSPSLPKISTHYERMIAPFSTSLWYLRAWSFLKQKMFKYSFKNLN